MKIMRMALRNVHRQKRRAIFLGGAVGIGFFMIVLMDSLTGGMTASLRSNITASNVGELYVSGLAWREDGRTVKRIDDDSLLRKAIRASGLAVLSAVPKSSGEVTAIYGAKSARTQIAGIPWEGSRSALGQLALSQGSLDGMADPDGIILPSSLAARLGVIPGETMLVKAATVTGQLNVAEFLVAGISGGSDGTELFQSSFARIDAVNVLFGLAAGTFQQLNLYLADGTSLTEAAARLSLELGQLGAILEPRKAAATDPSEMINSLFGTPVETAPWKGTKYSIAILDDFAGQFLTMLTSVKMLAYALFAVLLIICMTGIVNTFRMVLIERTREIGTMRAMGMRSRDVRRLFVLEAIIMTLSGAAAGLAGALVLMQLVSLVQFGTGMFGMFLTGGHVVFSVSPASIIALLALVMAAGSLAAFSPARSAAALKPADALRS